MRMLDTHIEEDESDESAKLALPEAVSLIKGRLNALEVHRRREQHKLDELMGTGEVVH